MTARNIRQQPGPDIKYYNIKRQDKVFIAAVISLELIINNPK